MILAEFHFHLKSSWAGGRLGEGKIDVGNLQTVVSIPGEMGGPGIGTNPDEMLLGAAATCYLITLASVLENRKLPVNEISLSTKGVVSDDGGLHFASITHKPIITLSGEATEEQVQSARTAVERAEKACMISKALRGNVQVYVEPEIRC
jgi:peroxiredoxin-like protein